MNLSRYRKIIPVGQCFYGQVMVSVRQARLVKITNSRGLPLVKPLLDQVGLTDEVDIEAAPGVLTIRQVSLRTLTTASAALEPPEAAHRR